MQSQEAEKHRILIKKVLHAIEEISGEAQEAVLRKALQLSREARYYQRKMEYREIWRPVLRDGYAQYEVSNKGFVRHAGKERLLRPAFSDPYPRVAMLGPDRRNGGQFHSVHHLVFEAFSPKLKKPLSSTT